jgi:hypothetical protein
MQLVSNITTRITFEIELADRLETADQVSPQHLIPRVAILFFAAP